MLFDLQGKRRRVVQATYLTLAVLMGGGLVLFGIGGDVSGGLFDAFSGDRGGGNGDSAIEKRIEGANERLRANPRDEAALKELVRANFQLAGSQGDPSRAGFPPEARDELAAAGRAWERYMALDTKRTDPSLATVALQLFDPTALNQPKNAQQAAAIIAEREKTPQAYLRLVQYATLAGDSRTADLAGDRALELAPRAQRKEVEQALKQAKTPPQQQGAAGGQGTGGQGGTQAPAPAPAPGG
ncbi:MAG: hypothetical protein M3088_04605 [Actinomycetota bacterium]|nr:hypothetical protein [Actinomycetota bacterium]